MDLVIPQLYQKEILSSIQILPSQVEVRLSALTDVRGVFQKFVKRETASLSNFHISSKCESLSDSS